MPLLSVAQTFGDYFRTLLSTLLEFQVFADMTLKVDSLLHHFRKLGEQQLSIILRSHMVILLGSEEEFMGRGPIEPLVIEWMQRISPTVTGWVEKSREGKEFVSILARPVLFIFRVHVFQPCMMRKKLNALLTDMGHLQNHASGVDNAVRLHMKDLQVWADADQQALTDHIADLQRRQAAQSMNLLSLFTPHEHPFFAFTFELTMQLLIHHTLLGFELEYYVPREYVFVYFQLEYLCDVKTENIKRSWRPASKRYQPPAGWEDKMEITEEEIVQREERRHQAVSKKNEKKREKRAKERVASETQIHMEMLQQRLHVTADMLLTEGTMFMAKAMFNLLLILQKENMLAGEHMDEEYAETWFMHRFSSHRRVPQPTVQHMGLLMQYVKSYEGIPTESLLGHVTKLLKEAKAVIAAYVGFKGTPSPDNAELARAKALLKVIVTTSVLVSGLMKTKAKLAEKENEAAAAAAAAVAVAAASSSSSSSSSSSFSSPLPSRPPSSPFFKIVTTFSFNTHPHFPIISVQIVENKAFPVLRFKNSLVLDHLPDKAGRDGDASVTVSANANVDVDAVTSKQATICVD